MVEGCQAACACSPLSHKPDDRTARRVPDLEHLADGADDQHVHQDDARGPQVHGLAVVVERLHVAARHVLHRPHVVRHLPPDGGWAGCHARPLPFPCLFSEILDVTASRGVLGHGGVGYSGVVSRGIPIRVAAWWLPRTRCIGSNVHKLHHCPNFLLRIAPEKALLCTPSPVDGWKSPLQRTEATLDKVP